MTEIDELRAERDALTAKLEEAKQALKPFAEVANKDVGMDEGDSDMYRPMSPRNARAPLLTVGDLRRAARLITEPVKGGDQ